jgi:hypothetical protein
MVKAPQACDLIGTDQLNKALGVTPPLAANRMVASNTTCLYDNGKGQSVSLTYSSGINSIPASLTNLRSSLASQGIVITEQPKIGPNGISYTTPEKAATAAFEIGDHLVQTRVTGLSRTSTENEQTAVQIAEAAYGSFTKR